MRPVDAARQLEYVTASKLEDAPFGHWDRTVYRDVFADVAERGTSEDVQALVGRLGDEFASGGKRPMPADARRYAESLLTEDGRPLTDGGEA